MVKQQKRFQFPCFAEAAYPITSPVFRQTNPLLTKKLEEGTLFMVFCSEIDLFWFFSKYVDKSLLL